MELLAKHREQITDALTDEALWGWRTAVPGCLSLLTWSLSLLMDSTALGYTALGLAIMAVGCMILTITVWAEKLSANMKMKRVWEHEARLAALKKELAALGCTQGEKQLALLATKFKAFTDMLARQFKRSELAFDRYNTMGHSVYHGAIDNLDRVARCLMSVASIKPDEIKARQTALTSSNVDVMALVNVVAKSLNVPQVTKDRPPLTKGAAAEMEQLDARLELRAKQHAIAEDCLAINEQAIMQFDVVTAELANITTKGSSLNELEDAMAELKRLVESTAKYDIEFSN